MGSVTVRNIKKRGWSVDISTNADGERRRSIKTFGRGARAKQAAEKYRDEQARELKTGKFWERRSATFRDLLSAVTVSGGAVIKISDGRAPSTFAATAPGYSGAGVGAADQRAAAARRGV